jgi:hypothetical protein
MTRQLDSLSLHDSQKTKISPQSPPTTLAPSGKLLFLKQTTKIPLSIDRLFVSSSSFLLFFFFFVSLEIARRLQKQNPKKSPEQNKQTNKRTRHHSMMLSKTEHKLMENSFSHGNDQR